MQQKAMQQKAMQQNKKAGAKASLESKYSCKIKC
jgi:hypothetical protein